MTVRYRQRSGQRIVPDYVCQSAGIASGQAPRQRIGGREIDCAIAELLLAVVTPETRMRRVLLQTAGQV